MNKFTTNKFVGTRFSASCTIYRVPRQSPLLNYCLSSPPHTLFPLHHASPIHHSPHVLFSSHVAPSRSTLLSRSPLRVVPQIAPERSAAARGYISTSAAPSVQLR